MGGVFFFFFLFLATTLYTAVRLIHSSAGLQYQNSNYGGIFFVIFGCHPSLDQKSLSYMQRPAWIVREKNPLHECCTCPKSWILTTFWWYPGRINRFFFPHASHSRGSARWIILLQCSCSPLWGVICSVFSVVMCCHKSLGSRCSRLSRERDNLVSWIWTS